MNSYQPTRLIFFILVVTNFDVKIILSRKSHTYDNLKNPYFSYYFKPIQCCLTCLLDTTIFKIRKLNFWVILIITMCSLGYLYHVPNMNLKQFIISSMIRLSANDCFRFSKICFHNIFIILQLQFHA